VEPVRVKLYGLVWMTRRRYLFQVALAGLLLVVLLAVWLVHWLRLGELERSLQLPPSVEWVITLLDLLPCIVAILVALQITEAAFVLRAFAREQARRSIRSADLASNSPDAKRN
jgi:hypothetical protein